jgi:hypothetical protein
MVRFGVATSKLRVDCVKTVEGHQIGCSRREEYIHDTSIRIVVFISILGLVQYLH